MTNIRKLMNDSVSGTTFISITTSTVPRLSGGKGNSHIGNTRKVTVDSNVMVFQNKTKHGYEGMVKRRLEKEGKNPNSFVLGDRVWGTRIPETPFVEHNGEFYLEVIFLHAGETHYELAGAVVPANLINGLPDTPAEGHQGGLNDKVIIRTFKISSLTSMVVNGKEYTDLEYIS